MRLIDADRCDEVIVFDDDNKLMQVSAVREYINNQKAFLDKFPTIDAVPVVRCRECEHYKTGVCLKIYYDGLASRYAWQERNDDDFCSYGERKEGADNG